MFGWVNESGGAHATPPKPTQVMKSKFLIPEGIERELDKLEKVALAMKKR